MIEHISSITLQGLLPDVFRGMEESQGIKNSEVWLSNALQFKRGCRICIHADSGKGKSSLLSFIYGNRDDYQGCILFNDRDIRKFGVEDWCEMRRRHIALLPQEMRLFPELTVEQNIRIKNSLTSHLSESQIKEMLNRFGIADKLHQPAGKLSIGQMQRVAIIRTLCQPFDFVFLDEPVSHLDADNNNIAAQLIMEEAEKQGAGIITTSVGNHLHLTDAETIEL